MQQKKLRQLFVAKIRNTQITRGGASKDTSRKYMIEKRLILSTPIKQRQSRKQQSIMNITAAYEWFEANYATRMDNLQSGTSTMILATHPHSFPFGSLILYWITILVLPRLLKNSPERKLTVIMSLWNGFLFIFSFIIFLGVGIPYFNDIRERGFFDVFCDTTQVCFSIPPLYVFNLRAVVRLT